MPYFITDDAEGCDGFATIKEDGEENDNNFEIKIIKVKQGKKYTNNIMITLIDFFNK